MSDFVFGNVPTNVQHLATCRSVCCPVVIAQLVPHLNIIISLVGALCSTGLALFIPAIIELVLSYGVESDGPTKWVLVKNSFVILLAFVGLITGTIESVNSLMAVISQK